jgi:hypothetical protein
LDLANTRKPAKQGGHVLAKLIIATIILKPFLCSEDTPTLFYGCGGGSSANGERLKRTLKRRQGLVYGGERQRALILIFTLPTAENRCFTRLTESSLHSLDFRLKHAQLGPPPGAGNELVETLSASC